MERLDFFQFDVKLYRDFDESTRAACRHEVYESFAHLLRGSTHGRLGKLLKSDYVFVNGLLATYYGIEGVTGDEFRKIKLPADSPRGGLLGMAAIHAMGSDGVVSSPVERGAWVLRHLLNDPPPPAPPNVPQISRLEGQILTTRERLLAHQEEAQCASCHRKIDPIGFGLENWGAAGKWRTEDSYQARDGRGRGVGKRKTWAIDASGAFHKGPEFNDYNELRGLIADREEDFARGFTERLIGCGLGRPFDEVFPFFSWLVAEVGFTEHKATGATIVVDAGRWYAQYPPGYPALLTLGVISSDAVATGNIDLDAEMKGAIRATIQRIFNDPYLGRAIFAYGLLEILGKSTYLTPATGENDVFSDGVLIFGIKLGNKVICPDLFDHGLIKDT